MKLTLPADKVYMGEVVTANLGIYLRDDVQNYGNIQFTGTPAEGFASEKAPVARRNRRKSATHLQGHSRFPKLH